MSLLRRIALTGSALLAFVGNSLLCRAALKHTPIDVASFTTIRLISGVMTRSWCSSLVVQPRAAARLYADQFVTARGSD